MSDPRVFTIPAGRPFVDALASGIVHLHGDTSEDLARVTVLLPTRRACRALRDAFLRRSEGAPMLLPRLLPLGDVDEDELLVEAWESPVLAGDGGLSIPPAMPGLRRQILLTRLIMARPDSQASPDQAARLARELARLLDQVHTERLDFAGLQDLVPDEFADHWQITLGFLQILTDVWPTILAAEGAIDSADRRNRVLEARAHLWQTNPPTDPVIAAGSTGSIPATAELLAVVARLPKGAVVLPGLDRDAGDGVWQALGPSHPQYGMSRLLEVLDVERRQVAPWPEAAASSPVRGAPEARTNLVTRAIRPAGADVAGDMPADDVETAMAGVTEITCPGPREEAAVIALAMRQVLETPGRTAALVTPDRGLARRVAADLRRWDVAIDDSAGLPLGQTPVGAFLRLVTDAVAGQLAPVSLLALLKHPLAGLGMDPAALRRAARGLEMSVLRGPRPAGGIGGLRAALPDGPGDHGTLVDRLEAALGPLLELTPDQAAPADGMVRAHVRAAEALAATQDRAGDQILWSGDAGEAAAGFVAELMEWGSAVETTLSAYPALFETLMAGRVVRPRFGAHPRLAIWGLLEARLQSADVVILGGLNEGVWPPEVDASPWMSRPMMASFGLPLPERRIGLSAHDFVQGFAAPEVMLTRADRIEGAPSVPCRWLRRLFNTLERAGHERDRAVAARWLEWAAMADRPAASVNVSPPRPTPPAAARPRRLSVTQVETLIRDPYAVYARHILGLKPLDPLDADPGAAERGSIIHHVLDRFLAEHMADLPVDAERRLLEIGRTVFDERLSRPGVRAFWWPRFERIATWFVGNERRRRAEGFEPLATEVDGVVAIPGTDGEFRLTARADRIDWRADAGYVIIDYKTGQPPSDKQIASGLAPQLPLEAKIAEMGGFEGVPAAGVAHLIYMRLSGGRVPGAERAAKLDVTETVEACFAGLARLVHKFGDPKTPYLSQPRAMFLSRFGEYDHLARVKEWRGRS